jgi:hypothetical protein
MDKFRYQWERVFIWDGPRVYASVILDWSKFAVFLFDKEEPAGILGLRPADAFEAKVLF